MGPRPSDVVVMLKSIGVETIDELIDRTVPSAIRLERPLQLPPPMSERDFTEHIRELGAHNTLCRSYLGQGYYDCITPAIIQRTILENPGWYTQYTPYQPEISQGRLEALLNYQTMVADLTGLEVANASLLDEGTSAAEAMAMLHGLANRAGEGPARNTFFVSKECFAQTIEVLRSRAVPLGITIVVGDHTSAALDAGIFGALLQYPGERGALHDYRSFIRRAHEAGVLVVMAADLLSLSLLTPPGELGADVAVGSAQRFGIPMGYGGPHAGYFATRMEFIRFMPGRIIGVSIDAQNQRAYRMTLQTREQHIKREKATSNICTAQALLAIMAGMYAVYHGPEGLRAIAERVHRSAQLLALLVERLGYRQRNALFFDTLLIDAGDAQTVDRIRFHAEERRCNLRYIDERTVGISLDETTSLADVRVLEEIFALAAGKEPSAGDIRTLVRDIDVSYPEPFRRTTPYLEHPVFHSYRSETQLLRYIKTLELKDLSLTQSMIPLGSCTMKLNPTTSLLPVTMPEFARLHPFVPASQAAGYQEVLRELEKYLCEITGFSAASFQPNSGAQGEFTGLSVIRAYHADRGDQHRTVALIPSSAHGTNPASAVMAGYEVVVVKCDEQGNIDVADLRSKAEEHRDRLGALMVTYPSTHGVFEEQIREICAIVHACGGQVYMDGANMNAQVGLTSPARIGADVCHLNLHKTFSIPHGGGGPGMGPICAAEHLAPFLPTHPVVPVGGAKGIHAVASAPWGSASILLISYAYIRMLGPEGVTNATKYAILNANYLKSRLKPHYPVLYEGAHGTVAHEFILNTRGLKQFGIEVEDIAKRLMDYGFHAPTVSFPVPGTLMIEPTESEPKEELDRFIEAMTAIRREIREIENGTADPKDNVLHNAPHTAQHIADDDWNHPYSRSNAAFPVDSLRRNKFWPAVGRINNTYGDRHVVCTCPPVEAYAGPTGSR